MTEAQGKLVELLAELDALCRQKDIPYFLYTKWYRAAVRSGGFENDCPDLSIMVFAEDARRLIAALKTSMPDGRYLEYLGNSGVFYRLCLAYGRKDTLDFNTLSFGTSIHYGLHINIELLRPVPTQQEEAMYQILETGWEAFCRPDVYSDKRQYAHDFVAGLVGKWGREKVASWTFDALISRQARDTSLRRVKIYQKSRYNEYPGDWFQDAGTVSFEGVQTPCMVGSVEYLEKHFGKKWESIPDKTALPNPMNRIVDANISYESFLSQLKKDDINLQAIWDLRLAFERQNAHVRFLREKRDKYWDLLFTCGDRYRLYHELSPRKDEILAIRAENDAKKLSKAMGDYVTKAVEHSKQGNVLYFDDELFECLCFVLRSTGQSTVADKITNMDISMFDAKLQIVDYRGNLVT